MYKHPLINIYTDPVTNTNGVTMTHEHGMKVSPLGRQPYKVSNYVSTSSDTGYPSSTTTTSLESAYVIKAFPVRIVDGKISINEYLMDNGWPYAFLYKGRTYIATRTDKKLRLDEVA